jgi:ATP synthase protein I
MSQKQRHPFHAMALMSAILAQLAGSTLVGVFLGRWLDHAIGTKPIFLIIGLFLGLGAGIYGMLRLVRQYFSGD